MLASVTISLRMKRVKQKLLLLQSVCKFALFGSFFWDSTANESQIVCCLKIAAINSSNLRSAFQFRVVGENGAKAAQIADKIRRFLLQPVSSTRFRSTLCARTVTITGATFISVAVVLRISAFAYREFSSEFHFPFAARPYSM